MEAAIQNRFEAHEEGLDRLAAAVTALLRAPDDGSRRDAAEELVLAGELFQDELAREVAVQERHVREQRSYDERLASLEERTQAARSQILRLKEEMGEKRLELVHREQYQILEKQLARFPSREELQRSVREMTQLADAAADGARRDDAEIETRRKQFGLFFHALQQLRAEWADPAVVSAASGAANGATRMDTDE